MPSDWRIGKKKKKTLAGAWTKKLEIECLASLSEDLLGKPYAVSSDTLYIYDNFGSEPVLHAYNISSWSYLAIIYLHQFAHLVADQLWALIVPVADFELCLLWHEGDRACPDTEDLRPLYNAMVSICLYPMAPTATLLKEAILGINEVEVINCLPYDSVSDDNDHSPVMEADVYGASSSSKRNARVKEHAALFQNVDSSAMVLDSLLQIRNTFTQIPSNAKLPPKKMKESNI
ncbi:unnamed protein product [Cuscuta campestris]|uniref:Uncharacterized protein n=1 Tax=Cuscuta campestris TaxID=132261 RepID=A0A484JZ87_9ASTE|nr:unnamed protein product [Cuscuta campestris]